VQKQELLRIYGLDSAFPDCLATSLTFFDAPWSESPFICPLYVVVQPANDKSASMIKTWIFIIFSFDDVDYRVAVVNP
jgi:hypothetical protein